jgi:hypothetical protein
MMKTATALAAFALLIPASAPAPAAAKKAADPDRQICKSQASIGSRLARKRICHSAQQWEDLALQDRLMLSIKQHNGDSAVQPMEQYVPPGRQAQMPQ